MAEKKSRAELVDYFATAVGEAIRMLSITPDDANLVHLTCTGPAIVDLAKFANHRFPHKKINMMKAQEFCGFRTETWPIGVHPDFELGFEHANYEYDDSGKCIGFDIPRIGNSVIVLNYPHNWRREEIVLSNEHIADFRLHLIECVRIWGKANRDEHIEFAEVKPFTIKSPSGKGMEQIQPARIEQAGDDKKRGRRKKYDQEHWGTLYDLKAKSDLSEQEFAARNGLDPKEVTKAFAAVRADRSAKRRRN